jgi:hypothetical protein
MAYDESNAQILRDWLAETDSVVERKMFGGLCFIWRGNMLCGVHKGGGMFRVGKDNEASAIGLPGVVPANFIGRSMSGMVQFDETVFGDEAILLALMGLGKAFVGALPPK